MKKITKKKRGRPPKNGPKLDIRIPFMVDAKRKRNYEKAAAQMKVKVGEFVRRACDAMVKGN